MQTELLQLWKLCIFTTCRLDTRAVSVNSSMFYYTRQYMTSILEAYNIVLQREIPVYIISMAFMAPGHVTAYYVMYNINL